MLRQEEEDAAFLKGMRSPMSLQEVKIKVFRNFLNVNVDSDSKFSLQEYKKVFGRLFGE